MLESWGLLGENQDGLDFGDALGFGADMLVDPLNLLSGGTLGALRGANKGIDAANAISKANALSNNQSLAMRIAGAMPEELGGVARAVPEVYDPQSVYRNMTTAGWGDLGYLGDPSRVVSQKPFHAESALPLSEADRVLDTLPGTGSEVERFDGNLKALPETLENAYQRVLSYQTITGDQSAWHIAMQIEDALRDIGPYANLKNRVPMAEGFASRDAAEAIREEMLRAGLPVDDLGLPVTHRMERPNSYLAKQSVRKYANDGMTDAVDVMRSAYQYGGQWREGVNPAYDALRAAGYDSVLSNQHGLPQVDWVANPLDQLFTTEVAPALRNVDPLQDRHNLSPLLAALLANNTLQAPYDLTR